MFRSRFDMNECCVPSTNNSKLIDESIDLLNAVCEPNRLRVLCVLSQNKICVCDLAKELKLASNLLSFHLKVLFEVGILDKRREGNQIFYFIQQDWRTRVEHFFIFIGTK